MRKKIIIVLKIIHDYIQNFKKIAVVCKGKLKQRIKLMKIHKMALYVFYFILHFFGTFSRIPMGRSHHYFENRFHSGYIYFRITY